MNMSALRNWDRWSASLICALAATSLFLATAGVAHAETDASYGRLITTCAIAINPQTHKVYAVDEGADQVVVTNEQTGSVHMVHVGKGPIALAINSRTNRIYVINGDSDSVSVIDGKQDVVTAIIHIRAGSYPYVIAANETTNKIYVANTYSDYLIVIDGSTNSVARLKVGSADAIIVDSQRNTIFLTTYEDPAIRIVKGATGAMTEVDVGAHLWGMAFDQSTDMLYLGHTGTDDIVELNVRTRAIHTVAVGSIPCAVALNPRTRMLYAVNYGSATVSVIDLKANKVAATLGVGDHPQAVAVDTLHARIYVANVHSDSITAIDGESNKVIGTYNAGRNPYALAIAPAAQRVYVANFAHPPVTIVDVAQAAAR